MAEEVVVKIWCDKCLADHDKKTEAEPIRVNGSRVDLCPECAKPILATLGLLEALGRKDGQPLVSGPAMCPVCGKGPFKGDQGLSMHTTRAHNKTWTSNTKGVNRS
jgi:hypothetical protein